MLSPPHLAQSHLVTHQAMDLVCLRGLRYIKEKDPGWETVGGLSLLSQRHIPKMALSSSGTFWRALGHQVGRCDGTGAHTKFPSESVPCSLKAGEGPAYFALVGQEPAAIPGKTTKGTWGRNVHPQ